MKSLMLHIESDDFGTKSKATWFIDGTPLASLIPISNDTVRSLRAVGREFQSRLQADGRPILDADELRAYGQSLYTACFEPAWQDISSHVQSDYELLISSQDSEVLNLPWELVELAHGPIGCDRGCSLLRSTLKDLPQDRGRLTPGPLRILFLAAASKDTPQLDYDREEDAMLQATANSDVLVRFAETGSLDELVELVVEHEPHVVHLSGHGQVDSMGVARFGFEDKFGGSDNRDAADINARAFRATSVRCLLLNGCNTAHGAVASLCEGFVREGVPLAVGWSASVADDRAAQFVETFYRFLALGRSVPVATAHARMKLREQGRLLAPRLEATFVLPQVYCSVSGTSLFDTSVPSRRAIQKGLQYSLIGDGITGLTQGYVGHRRERRQLLRALRNGEATFAIITGIPGAGKSTLATRTANYLEASGFTVEPLRAKRGGTRAEVARDLLTRLKDVLARAIVPKAPGDQERFLTTAQGEKQDPLQAIRRLNDVKCLIVLDGFEEVLDPDTLQISEPELTRFYVYLATQVVRGSRVLVTSQWVPAETPKDLPLLLHLQLPELEETDFREFMHRDPKLDERINGGIIALEMLKVLYQSFGGTPGFLHTLRQFLAMEDPEKLADRLEAEAPGPLEQRKEQYYERICPLVYAALTPPAQVMLGHLAVSDLPLPVEAISAITEFTPAVLTPLVQTSVAYGFVQQFKQEGLKCLYRPPGLLRQWLIRKELAHRVAQTHGKLARFWRTCYEGEQEIQVWLTRDAQLCACRQHAQQAEDWPLFQWATIRLARTLRQRGAWQTALEKLQEVQWDKRSAECLLEMAQIENLRSEWKAARAHLEDAQNLSARDPAMHAAVLHQLATVDYHEGNTNAARRELNAALKIRHAAGDREGEAETLTELAGIARHEGNISQARSHLQDALEICRGDKFTEATILHELGSVDLREHRFIQARDTLKKSLKLREQLRDLAGIAATYHQLASVDLSENRLGEARQVFETALKIRRDIGDRAGEAATLHQLASVDLNERRYSDARVKFERALQIRREINDIHGEAASLHQLGSTDRSSDARLQDFPAARVKLSRALEIRERIGERAGIAATLHELGLLEKDKNDDKAARLKFDRALKMWRKVHDKLGEASALRELAMLHLRKRDYRRAWAKLDEGLLLSQQVGGLAIEQQIFRDLGCVAHHMGHVRIGGVLVAISRNLRAELGSAETVHEFQEELAFRFHVGYTPKQLEKLVSDAEDAYQEDRGRGFVQRTLTHKKASPQKPGQPNLRPHPRHRIKEPHGKGPEVLQPHPRSPQ